MNIFEDKLKDIRKSWGLISEQDLPPGSEMPSASVPQGEAPATGEDNPGPEEPEGEALVVELYYPEPAQHYETSQLESMVQDILAAEGYGIESITEIDMEPVNTWTVDPGKWVHVFEVQSDDIERYLEAMEPGVAGAKQLELEAGDMELYAFKQERGFITPFGQKESEIPPEAPAEDILKEYPEEPTPRREPRRPKIPSRAWTKRATTGEPRWGTRKPKRAGLWDRIRGRLGLQGESDITGVTG